MFDREGTGDGQPDRAPTDNNDVVTHEPSSLQHCGDDLFGHEAALFDAARPGRCRWTDPGTDSNRVTVTVWCSMYRAVIFDFNGVLADDEPVHMEAFQFVAAREGLTVTQAEYFERFLPFSDWDLFRTLFDDRQRTLELAQLDALVERKVERYYRILDERGRGDGKSVLFPGARAAIDAAAALGPVAIASGARGKEIDFILESAGLRDRFSVVVAAEDVERGKPHPEPFEKAVQLLDTLVGENGNSRYLAIEDSRGGILAAKAAGLPCLAVEHSYDGSQLQDADWTIPSIDDFANWLNARALA